MKILNFFSGLFHKHASIAESLSMESQLNDEIASKGFASLLDVLNQSMDTLEIIKNNQKPHLYYFYPAWHPFHDTWD